MSARLNSILSVACFAAAWLALIFSSAQNHRIDVDLGAATSALSLRDNALWCLPLALLLWMPCEAALVLFHSRSRRTGRASR